MFQPKAIQTLISNYKPVLKNLHQIEANLNSRFYGMQEPIHALILSCASGEPLLLIGPPGTAKSNLIRAFCDLLNLYDLANREKPHPGYFEYLLTPFTEPNELFGYFDIVDFLHGKNGELKRIEENMMQKAEVVYLDEVFNASSAILNSLLAFLNERFFHDRGHRTAAQWKALFAATNNPPETPELKAVFDRFVLRCWVKTVSSRAEDLKGLFEKGWTETYSANKATNIKYPHLLRKLGEFRSEFERMVASGDLKPDRNSLFYQNLSYVIDNARRYNLSEMSNRRVIKMVYIMLIDLIYTSAIPSGSSAPTMGWDQLKLLSTYFLDNVDNEAAVSKLQRKQTNG